MIVTRPEYKQSTASDLLTDGNLGCRQRNWKL